MNQLTIFCDGGARGNPGPAAIGVIIKDDKGRVLLEKGEYIGKTTNNVAEYQAAIQALKWLIKHQPQPKNLSVKYQFFLDSLLVVNQLNGKYKIKNLKLQPLAIRVKELESQLGGKINYHHVLRERNKEADKLLNQALDKFPQKT